MQPLNGMVQAHSEKVVAVDGLQKCLVLANLQVNRIDEDLKDDAEAIDEECWIGMLGSISVPLD